METVFPLLCYTALWRRSKPKQTIIFSRIYQVVCWACVKFWLNWNTTLNYVSNPSVQSIIQSCFVELHKIFWNDISVPTTSIQPYNNYSTKQPCDLTFVLRMWLKTLMKKQQKWLLAYRHAYNVWCHWVILHYLLFP